MDGQPPSSARVAACLRGEPSPAQVAAAITAMRMRGETVGEIVACARAMRVRMLLIRQAGALEISMSLSSEAMALPSVIEARARTTPSRRVSALPATRKPAAAFSTTASW